MELIRIGRTLEEVLELERQQREIKWPYTLSPMTCPRCTSGFSFDSEDAKGQFPAVKFDDRVNNMVYFRCPNCGPKDRWHIYVWRTPKKFNWFGRELNDEDYYEHGPLWDWR